LRWLLWGTLVTALLLALVNLAVVALLMEGVLHPPVTRHPSDVAMLVHDVENSTGAKASAVSITSKDGVLLKGWWLTPPGGALKAVMICHGVGDSAMGSLGFSWLFLRHGYAVLLPESRGHGQSAGFVTYGVREADDVVAWLCFTRARGAKAVYALGESLGGAILLQSLARGADFQAVVAESAYASFLEVADDRIAQVVWPPLARLLVREGVIYTKLRYHVDLAEAQPASAVATIRVPVLLIHGADDRETLPKHSLEIAKANPAIQLWIVPGAPHTGAYAAAPLEFEDKVLAWFSTHETLR